MWLNSQDRLPLSDRLRRTVGGPLTPGGPETAHLVLLKGKSSLTFLEAGLADGPLGLQLLCTLGLQPRAPWAPGELQGCRPESGGSRRRLVCKIIIQMERL